MTVLSRSHSSHSDHIIMFMVSNIHWFFGVFIVSVSLVQRRDRHKICIHLPLARHAIYRCCTSEHIPFHQRTKISCGQRGRLTAEKTSHETF